MPRPKACDEIAVQQAAMLVFRRKGYVATSMSDSYAATGLKPGNLYATFTDKETLFRRAFDACASQFRASLPQGLQGRAAIVAWLDTRARLAIDDPKRKGCLIINTVTEREAQSPETRALATARLDEITTFFRTELTAAQALHEVPKDIDIPQAAAALTGAITAIMAIMALGRARSDATTIRAVAQSAAKLLERPEKRSAAS